MKNIWIDGYEANVPQRLGSGQVAFELIRNIEKYDDKNHYTILLPSPPLADLPKERFGFGYKILKPGRLWTRLALPLALFTAKNKPDVFFSPTHYIPRFSPRKTKRVVTIFDLSFLKFPKMFQKNDLYKLSNWSKYSILNSDHIITISQFSKKDIIKNYPIAKEKITVFYPGYDQTEYRPVSDKNTIEKTKERYSIKDNYIIYIGTLQPRKNLIKLIEAVSRIEKIGLVIVGKTTGLGRQAWMYDDILGAPKKFRIEERVIFTGFVPLENMPYLICGAVAFVQPSLYEGFGMTPVEAMACGIPVLVSNVSSFPEVIGKAGLLFDPYKVDQIEQAIRTIITDRKLRLRLSKLSIEQAKKFSWKKMAKGVVKVLELI